MKNRENKKLYLKGNVIIEPIIWNWYAWPYLIAPLTAGCSIAESHIKIMESFVESAEIHEEISKDSSFTGSSFMNLGKEHVNDIEKLLLKTKDECKNLISLSKDLKKFDKTLQESAKGASLECLYKLVPTGLKGCLEIVYDLNSHPSIRLLESIIYNKYYSRERQQISLFQCEENLRPFVFSTPRISTNDNVQLPLPFSDINVDNLARMRVSGINETEVESLLDISQNNKDKLASYFSEACYQQSDAGNYSGDKVRIRYFGHACVLLQTINTSILIDPVISYQNKIGISRYSFHDLPDKIDYVLLTHNHQDHVLIETLLQLRHKIKKIIIPASQGGVLVDPSLKLILENIGFNSIVTLSELEHIDYVDGEIVGVPFFGEHADLNIQTKLAYYINLKGNNLLFCADSNNLEPQMYENVFNILDPVDFLFIGMECDGAPLSWLYGPLLTKPLNNKNNLSRRLSGSNSIKAWDIVRITKCKAAYVYAMGLEPWLKHIMGLNCSEESIQIIESNKFINLCKDNNIISERLYGKKQWFLPGK